MVKKTTKPASPTIKADGADALLSWFLQNDVEIVLEPEITAFAPTGSLYLDFLFGGGLPRGRWTTIWGAESQGKTTIALLCAKAALNRGEKVLFVDVEHAIDAIWASNFGLKIDEASERTKKDQLFFLIQPSSAEKALNAVMKATALKDAEGKSIFGLIVIDSLAALATEAELAGEIGDSTVAGTARALAQYYRSAKQILADSDVAILQLNQERDDFGATFGYGRKVRQPGGRAVRYYSSIIAETKQKPVPVIDKDTGEVVGLQLKMKVTKNKVSRPGREAVFSIFTDTGESNLWEELAALGREFNIFTREDGSPISGSGFWWLMSDQERVKVAVGQAAVAAALDADRELAAEVLGIVRERIARMNRSGVFGAASAGDSQLAAGS